MTEKRRIALSPADAIGRGVLRFFAVLALVDFGCASEPPAPDLTSIDEVLRSAVERGEVPGLVAAAVGPSGVVYQGAFGKRDVAADIDMTVDSIFRIASMTKAVTSVAAMQLYEQGAFEIDDPAGNYVPELADVRVLTGFDENTGAPLLRPPNGPVTVRHLLTHTSGFAYEFSNEALRDYVSSGGVPSVFAGGDGFLHAPLVFDPGSTWEYGISTDWLGRVVETVSGQSLDEYFRQHIFEPLGMNDSHFNVPAEKEPRLSTVHQRVESGSLIEGERQPPPVVTFFSGGGGLSSTAADYLRFVRILLNDGSSGAVRILAPETVALMAENHIGDLQAGTVKSFAPNFLNDVDLNPGAADRFGLGFLLNADPVPGGRSAGSLTWAGIYNTYFWIDREQQVAGVLMLQILPFYDPEGLAVLEKFERAVYAALAR